MAMWWWIDRWRHSSAYTGMSLEAQGAYRNLLDECWLRGGVIPDDDETLARACGDPRVWPKIKRAVLKHFTRHPDGLRHDTLDEVIRESRRRADKQRRYRARQSPNVTEAETPGVTGSLPSSLPRALSRSLPRK